MPDFAQLKTFILTSELGSLAAAAAKLNISPAAVSKQLSKLEEELGLQLLVRTTRKINLTEIGISYFHQCQRILEEVETAQALISQTKLSPSGHLRVVSGRHFAVEYILPNIQKFLTKYPQIELDLELAERIPNLSSERIDLVIGMSISATGDAIQRRIATTSYTLCASPAYLKKFGIPQIPNDLKNHRYIAHSMRNPDNELYINKQKTVVVTPYIRVNDTQAMLDLALQGLGIVMLHDYVVRKSISEGLLNELLVDYKQPEVPIYIAYPQRRYVSSKVRCFIDFMLKIIAQELA